MRELWHVAKARATALLGTPGVPSALIAALLDSTSADRHRHLELFEVLVRQAHLDVQSRRRLGKRFLKQAGATIEAMIIGDVLDHDTANELTLAYARAHVRPPEGLVALVMPEVTALADSGRYTGQLDAEVDRLRRRFKRDIHTVHMALNDRFDILAPEARAAAVRNIAGRDEDHCGHLALYWLLDASAEVRLAAASALHARVQRGIVDSAFVALMPPLSSLIPPDEARRVLDAAAGDLRRRGPFSPLQRPPRRPSRLLALLPEDGAHQGFVAVLERRDDLALAVFTTETGRGLDEAFLLEHEKARASCRSGKRMPTRSSSPGTPSSRFSASPSPTACGRPSAAGRTDRRGARMRPRRAVPAADDGTRLAEPRGPGQRTLRHARAGSGPPRRTQRLMDRPIPLCAGLGRRDRADRGRAERYPRSAGRCGAGISGRVCKSGASDGLCPCFSPRTS